MPSATKLKHLKFSKFQIRSDVNVYVNTQYGIYRSIDRLNMHEGSQYSDLVPALTSTTEDFRKGE
jgi:hypothetical protein